MVIRINSNSKSTVFGMNTVITYNVFGEQSDYALKVAEEETYRLEAMLSRFIPGSDISRINCFAGSKPEKVNDETYELLSKAIEFSKRCGGCFDVTIGPLVALWNEAKDTLEPPNVSKIKKAVPLVGYRDLIMQSRNKSIVLKRSGQSIDLGGIGKGFAADKVLEVFKKFGVSSAYTNFGGNVAVIGAKPDGSVWRVGIQHPRQENKLVGVISVIDNSVVTSGDYQRYYIGNNGNRYHHILNPSTGYPAQAGLISATIVAKSSLEADALSTILFVAGAERGIRILKSFPETEAILIDEKLSVYITRGLVNCFQPCDSVNINIIN